MKLYTYFRSSAAYRVRIALNLKGLDYEAVPVHLLREGGQHLMDNYLTINPSGLVPALQDDRMTLTQSMAIIEYLDELHPMVPLLPKDAVGRARVRELAQIIACFRHVDGFDACCDDGGRKRVGEQIGPSPLFQQLDHRLLRADEAAHGAA